ncbi:MAG: exopolysaccharide biosynthesis polyprenyl glycosylphosphotransferase [Rhodobacterales bacterium]|nr:exopolysaccharide biosynthesis polyprenyl glycosylphosphotransferase [Rhodobacterales bacterium]
MKYSRQPLLDLLALTVLWAFALVARAQLDLYWRFDLLPNTQILQPVSIQNSTWMGLILIPTWLALLGATGSWRPRAAIQTLGTAVPIATLTSLALFELLRFTPVSRSLLLGFAVLTLPMLALARWKPLRAHRVLLVGSPSDLTPWQDAVLQHPAWGIQVVGPVLPADSPQIEAIAQAQGIHEIYAAGPIPARQLRRIDAIAAKLQAALSVDATFLDATLSQAQLSRVGHCTLITFVSPPKAQAARAAKRAIDLLFASVLLVLSAPIVTVAAIAIRLEDSGPAWFVQQRVGQHGRSFPMFKLRSMVPNAHALRKTLQSDEPGPIFKLNQDPRVTTVGRFLRRTSIDELPQLLNVIRGEMSLVGPRPPLPEEVIQYEPWQLRRLSVPPGLTGMWQVSGRANIQFNEWMALDLHYVDHWTLWLDLKLLLRTIPTVILGIGAR